MSTKDMFEKALALEGVTGQLAEVAKSIYMQESGGGKNTKTSNAGARGGMQIIPQTFKSVADKDWDINDPVQNARAGIRYLKQLDKQSGGNPVLTAAGYYGGPGGLEKARRGIAVGDPRNPNAPNTLQYGQQVAARLGNGKKSFTQLAQAAVPQSAPPAMTAVASAAPPTAMAEAPPVPVMAAMAEAMPQAIPTPQQVEQAQAYAYLSGLEQYGRGSEGQQVAAAPVQKSELYRPENELMDLGIKIPQFNLPTIPSSNVPTMQAFQGWGGQINRYS